MGAAREPAGNPVTETPEAPKTDPFVPSRYYVKRTAENDPFLKDGEVAWQEAPILPHMVKKDWESPAKILEKAKSSRAMELLLAARDITLRDLEQELNVNSLKLRRILTAPKFQEKLSQELDSRCSMVVRTCWDWIDQVMKLPGDDAHTLSRKDAMARFVITRHDKVLKMTRREVKKEPQGTGEIAKQLMEMARESARTSGQRVQIGVAVSAEPEPEEDLSDLLGETLGVEEPSDG